MALQLHPNGFIQWDLPNGSRMHIWADGLPQAQKVYTPIHDHAFEFTSRVVMGKIAHQIYTLWPVDVPYEMMRATAPVYDIYDVNGQFLEKTDQQVRARMSEGVVTRQGQEYAFGGLNRYHVTEKYNCEIAATIMTKHWLGGGNPHVLVPAGIEPDNAFRRDQYDENLLMSYVERVRKYLDMRNA